MTARPSDKVIDDFVQHLTPHLEAFLGALEQEATHLRTGSAEQLQQISLQKQRLAEEIERQRQLWGETYPEHPLELNSLLAFAQASALPPDLATQIQHLHSLIERCYQLNQTNGVTIQSLNNINQHLLQLYTGQTKTPDLYTSRGATKKGTNPLRIPLGKA
ncbi:MAG: flagellar protein FlgN [Thiotrichales bacterium]|nr:flagellar protein FlgN [Thiotrichales bacterium]